MMKTIAILAMVHYVATFGGGPSLPLLSRLGEHGRRDSRGSIVCTIERYLWKVMRQTKRERKQRWWCIHGRRNDEGNCIPGCGARRCCFWSNTSSSMLSRVSKAFWLLRNVWYSQEMRHGVLRVGLPCRRCSAVVRSIAMPGKASFNSPHNIYSVNQSNQPSFPLANCHFLRDNSSTWLTFWETTVLLLVEDLVLHAFKGAFPLRESLLVATIWL